MMLVDSTKSWRRSEGMKVRVLVVDDSAFFRRRLSEILNEDNGIEVIATAANGLEATKKVLELKPDVVTMDVEMPVMNGISAVRQIMSHCPVPILMFSYVTQEGAQATFDALEAGAMDFLPKQFNEIAVDRELAKGLLRARVRTLGLRRNLSTHVARDAAGRRAAPARVSQATRVHSLLDSGAAAGRYRVVGIGTSTGGPIALQDILRELPADFPAPLLVVQHMPASFTGAFAQRLDQVCNIRVKEAADGDVLRPGLALLAPGGRQMVVEKRVREHRVRIIDANLNQHYRPSVDVTFTSVAEVFPASALAIVLTGMGADGREGARLLKGGGSTVWAQDESSCVVYGMPMAVIKAGLADKVLPLAAIGLKLSNSF